MGQKVHSIGFRIPFLRKWDSQWFTPLNYDKFLHQDYQIRKYLAHYLKANKLIGDSPIIKRKLGKIYISLNVYNVDPTSSFMKQAKRLKEFKKRNYKLFNTNLLNHYYYLLIQKKIRNFNDLPIKRIKKVLSKLTNSKVYLTIKPTKTINKIPYFNAPILAQYLTHIFLTRKFSFINRIKRIISIKSSYIKGIKIVFSGRIKGLGRSNVEKFKEGSMPLQTINSKIDYGYSKALNKYGLSGIKVWICYN